MKLRTLALTLVLAAAPECVFSAEPISLPLGNLSPGSTTPMERPRGIYDLKLNHVVPGAVYTFTVATSFETLQAPKANIPAALRPQRCDPVLTTLATDVNLATTEEAVEQAERKALGTNPNCIAEVNQAIDGRALLFKGAVTVRGKSVSEINVKRNIGNDERTWTVEVRTGPGAVWTTMSVLAAVMDDGERYFAESAPLTNADGTMEERFRLIREDHGLELRPGAGVGFFLVPEKQREKNLAHTFMAGFGLTDSKTPLVGMIGYGILIGDHVSITIGAATTLERHLLRRYRDKDFIPEALTNDQLTGEDFVVRPFFSIGIDFNGFDLAVGKKSQ